MKLFVDSAEESGHIPVCLMLYSSHDLTIIKRGRRWDEALLRFLDSEGIRYVDTAKYVLDRYSKDDDFRSLRVADGHLNENGERMVARALAEGLTKMKLLDINEVPAN